MATAAALQAGGAVPVCWDDNPDACAKAEVAGYEVADLNKDRTFEGLAALIVSPMGATDFSYERKPGKSRAGLSVVKCDPPG